MKTDRMFFSSVFIRVIRVRLAEWVGSTIEDECIASYGLHDTKLAGNTAQRGVIPTVCVVERVLTARPSESDRWRRGWQTRYCARR